MLGLGSREKTRQGDRRLQCGQGLDGHAENLEFRSCFKQRRGLVRFDLHLAPSYSA